MQKTKARILSTAILSQSLIDMGRENGMIIDTISFTDIRPSVNEETEKKIAEFSSKKMTAVFTSAHAAETLINKLQSKKPDWKIYCTAGNTKKTVSKYFGEGLIAGAGANAVSIADKIVADHIKEVLFFCGNLRRDEIPSSLANHGIKVHEVAVYNTILTPQPVDNNYNGILFFSPSAVESYFSANKPEKEVVLFAIGDTTAGSIKKFSQNKIVISESPEKEGLSKLAIRYFQNHPVHYPTHDQFKK
ncbi:MAG TPA: uroporphyrinogen-III synthase [Puia sp.]|nr:uroporphyrinogen-III synthase [Puia sp.]